MNFLNLFKNISKKNQLTITRYYYGLIDCNSSAVLVAGKNFQAMNFLKEFTFDSFFIYLPVSSRYEESLFNGLTISETPYLFRWDEKTRSLIENKNVSDNLIIKTQLAQKKYSVLDSMMLSIIFLRDRVRKTLPYQETIYMAKQYQAERFKDRGYPEHEMLEYPYVLQYADFMKISLKDAADKILLKSKIDNELLAKTEMLRLKYFNMVKDAKSVDEAEEAHKKFLLDFSIKI
jgi:hypothetical protein